MQNIKFYNSGFLKDYICPEDISNTTITIENGDYLTYNTNPEGDVEWVNFNPIHDKLATN